MRRGGLLALALLTLTAAPAAACNAGERAAAARQQGLHGPPPWLIGDSTSILAAPHLGRLGVAADARGCRQFDQGIAMIAGRARKPDAVVLALGANGDVSRAQIGRARRAVGRERFLALVTPRNDAGTRQAMLAAARAHPDRVLTLDWTAASAGHQGWFFGDGLHVSFSGARIYARFVAAGLRPFLGAPRRGRPLGLPERRAGARACGRVRAFGRRTEVYVTRGDLDCKIARTRMRGPRMHPPPDWRFYDWRRVRRGPWTDVLAHRDRSIVVAGISR